jgi:hypothetical protein
VINIQRQSIVAATPSIPPVRRIGPRAFWVLFAVEGAFVATVLLVIIHLVIPARAPLAASTDYMAVRDAIWSRVNGVVADPLIEVKPGVSVRESNVRGFTFNGQVYYYYFEGQRGFDPLSRRIVDANAIDIVLRDDAGPKTLIIYRLL